MRRGKMKAQGTIFQLSYLNRCLIGFMALGLSSVTTAEDKKLSIAELPVITVYAEQTYQPGSYTVITQENLEQTGAQNMADIVKYLPLVNAPYSVYGGGSYFDSSGTSGYNIRGVESNRVGLDIDGVDIADAAVSPFLTNASMSKRGAGRDYIEPEMLQAVDIASGTTDASTDGIGGRVSFKNKSPNDFLKNGKKSYGAAKAGYSSADEAWLTSVTGAVGSDDVKALVAYAHREGHQIDGNSKTKAFDADWKLDAVLASLSWNLNDQHQIKSALDLYRKDVKTIGMDATASSSFADDNASQKQNIERTTFSIEDIFIPSSFALFDQLKSKAWYQKSENKAQTIYNTGAYIRDFRNNYDQTSYGLKLDAKKDFANQKLKYGLNIERKKYDSDRDEFRSNGKPPPFTGTYLTASTLDRYAMYVSDQFDFEPQGKALSITPSLRIEHQRYRPEDSGSKIEDRDFTYLAPSLTASYQATPSNYTYFKYAHGARIPSPMEMGGSYETSNGATYLVMGNSNLKKETSDTFEIGLKNNAIDGLQVGLTTFYTKYNDFIDYYDHGNAIPGYFMVYRAENIADAAIWGGELSARVDFGYFMDQADGFSLALVAGKTKGHAKNKDGLKTGMNSVQPEKGSLTFAFDDPNKVYGLGLTTTAVGSKTATVDASSFVTNPEKTQYKKVSGYTVWDLSAYWNINKATKFNVALNNIFDKTYWNYSSVGTLNANDQATAIDRAAAPGRNVVASVEFKF